MSVTRRGIRTMHLRDMTDLSLANFENADRDGYRRLEDALHALAWMIIDLDERLNKLEDSRLSNKGDEKK